VAFGAAEGTAPVQALAGQDPIVSSGQALVLAIKIANLARSNANVAGGNIDGGADMAEQLGHERLAEAHDLVIGSTLGIKVGAALGAAEGKAGQRVLEDLLEAEKLDDAGIDVGVKAQATLVRPESGVKLDPVALVDLDGALIINPRHAEKDLPLRLDNALNNVMFLVLWIAIEKRLK
jgi:hypothetical protein